MRHAIFFEKPDNIHKDYIEASLMPDRTCYLAQAEYSQEELEEFDAEAKNWILNCEGSSSFTADTESGEDADGYFSEYFELTKEMAVFDKGKFVGICVCPGGFSYSGNGRASFTIDSWHFKNIFDKKNDAKGMHVFLFANEETHRWVLWGDDWVLLKREPDKKYRSRLSF